MRTAQLEHCGGGLMSSFRPPSYQGWDLSLGNCLPLAPPPGKRCEGGLGTFQPVLPGTWKPPLRALRTRTWSHSGFAHRGPAQGGKDLTPEIARGFQPPGARNQNSLPLCGGRMGKLRQREVGRVCLTLRACSHNAPSWTSCSVSGHCQLRVGG